MGIRKGAGGAAHWGLGGFVTGGGGGVLAVRTGQLTLPAGSALLPACAAGLSFVILTVGQRPAAPVGAAVCGPAADGYPRRRCCAGRAEPAGSTARRGETIQLPALDAVIAQAAVTYLKLCGFVLYFRLLAAGVGIAASRGRRCPPCCWKCVPARSGRPHRAVGQHAVLCGAQCAGGVGAFAGAHYLPGRRISLRPLLAARAVHLPLSVALFWLGSTVPVQAVQTLPP